GARDADTVAIHIGHLLGGAGHDQQRPLWRTLRFPQTYSPVFSVTVSGDTRTPSVNVSADTVNGLRTSRAAARTRMRNGDFIVLLTDKLHSFAQWSIGSLDESIQGTVHFQN